MKQSPFVVPSMKQYSATRRLSNSKSTTQRPELPQSSLDNYKFTRVLGKGSYAVVKEAVHLQTQQRFAVKSYSKKRLTDLRRFNNVMREAKILKKLDHKWIVKCHEVVDDGQYIHLVMDYVDGISLACYLKKFPINQLPLAEARKVFTQLLEGLDYCHSQQVTHRDLKLENVLIDRESNVKLVDFGFSTDSAQASNLFCGTPSYMAPEIVTRKEHCGPPVDIWALGVILFAMCNGQFPFKGRADKELYRNIQIGAFEVPEVTPLPVRVLIKRMLHPNPAIRPTAKELIQNEWVSYGLTKERVRHIIRKIGSQGQFIETPPHRGYAKRRHYSQLNKENF